MTGTITVSPRRTPVPGPPRLPVATGAGGPSTERSITATARASRVLVIAVCIGIATMPILKPATPGNTGLPDIGIVLAILAMLLVAANRHLPVKLPFALPVVLTVTAGALAALVGPGGLTSMLALTQDLFLLLWCAAIVMVGRDPNGLRTVLRCWTVSALFAAGVLVVGVITGVHALSGINARDGSRASLTFGDPNLAANYFIVGLMVMRATGWPVRRGRRVAGCVLFVAAIALTGSNGGMLALAAATVFGALFQLGRRRGAVPVITVVALTLAAAGILAPRISISSLRQQASDSNQFLHDSFGRSGQSTDERGLLLKEGLKLWRGHNLIGLGPGMTKQELTRTQAPYVKEAHDDYLAALVERGLLGGIALVVLIALIVRRLAAVTKGPLEPGYAALVPRPELLAAAALAFAIAGAFYEVLHFRHLWALLGVVAALAIYGVDRR